MKQLLSKNPITATVSAITLIFYFVPGAASLIESTDHNNSMIALAQTLGSHLRHWSGEHLFWDLGMFVIVGGLCERVSKTKFAWTLAISAALIPAVVLVAHPELGSYRGLSGIDTALFGLGAITLVIQKARENDRFGVAIFSALIAGMIAKIGYELIFGQTLFVTEPTFLPVPVAHVVGAAVGLIIGATDFWASNRFGKQSSTRPHGASNWRPPSVSKSVAID